MPEIPIPPVEQSTPDFQQLMPHMFRLVLQTNAQHILETGTDVGDSARIWATALQFTGGKLTTVDKENPRGDWYKPQIWYNVTCLKADAKTFEWAEPIDVLFLDDEHTYPHVLEELRRLGPWVRVGGYIVLHDILHSEFGGFVQRAMLEFARQFELPTESINLQHGLGLIHMTKALPKP